MRIAIIGSGISGLTCAWLLHRKHNITLFEKDARVGGHVHTVNVPSDTGSLSIDTGFIVFNDRTYPNFCRILKLLKVPSKASSMSFSIVNERSGLEYSGGSFAGLFAQRRNLFRPSFLRLLRDILRFHRRAADYLSDDRPEETVREFLARERFSDAFSSHYLIPLTASIWSAPPASVDGFPMRFLLRFLSNHGMLQVFDRPTWRVVGGGSETYVRAMCTAFDHRIRRESAVKRVTRDQSGVQVRWGDGESALFDEVIFACHADQALRILADASEQERVLLEAFPYQANDAILHTDHAVLPKNRRAWSSWNYRIPASREERVSITYNMNMLQGIRSESTYCVTLNAPEGFIDEGRVIKRIAYQHPSFSLRSKDAQSAHEKAIRVNRTSFCGAYWRYGFHEDGVRSALAVCERFGKVLPSE